MPHEKLTFKLNKELADRLDQMSRVTQQSQDYLFTQAIQEYLNREEGFVHSIQTGLQSADEGRLVDHSYVKEKWVARRSQR